MPGFLVCSVTITMHKKNIAFSINSLAEEYSTLDFARTPIFLHSPFDFVGGFWLVFLFGSLQQT